MPCLVSHGTRHSRHGSIHAWGALYPNVTPPLVVRVNQERGRFRQSAAVRNRRETLNTMETMRQDSNGANLTTMGAVEEINRTATAMEALYDANQVAKTHLGLRE